MANFKKYTRYTNGIIYKNRNNQDFLKLRKSINLEPESGDTFIVIGKDLEFRPDLISTKAYGTADLWWVICEFNSINDPLFDLRMGQILRIPNKDRILNAIKKIGT